ncbi:hypothetical protein P9112_008898 [Eukaryota sp. TZLM1-RC]
MVQLVNFYALHLVSFVSISIIGSFIIWHFEHNSYIDSLFLAVTSITDTGLLSSDLQSARFVSQAIVLLLIVMGFPILWTLVPLILRRRFLVKQFDQLVVPTTPKPDQTLDQIPQKPLPLYTYSVEYWAMGRLLLVVISYCFFFLLIGFLSLCLRFYFCPQCRETAEEVGGWLWFSIFHSIAAFTNAGISIFGECLTPFRNDPWILLTICGLIVGGQTGFPFFLRLICLWRSKRSSYSTVYSFLLDKGRLVYTHLFNTTETAWLGFWWLVFFFVQFIGLIVFDLELLATRPYLNAFFMTISTRVCGFSTINLGEMSMPMLNILILLQVLAATPFISILRKSAKVIEDSDPEPNGIVAALRKMYKTQQTNPWARDFLWIYASWLVMTITVHKNLQDFMFSSLYEVSSAYGNIGLSTGWPDTSASFVGVSGTCGRFLIIVVMLAGRHRGLPSSVDKAVSTLTFDGVADDVLHLLPEEVVVKMGVQTREIQDVKDSTVLDPLIVKILSSQESNQGETVTFQPVNNTFPPRRGVNLKDIKKLMKEKRPNSVNTLFDVN